jgi:hypothetical protein
VAKEVALDTTSTKTTTNGMDQEGDHHHDEIMPDNKENQIGLGLRQRRGKTKSATTTTTKGTVTTNVDPLIQSNDTDADDDDDDTDIRTPTDMMQDELMLLRKANPIELFGALPSRDLRQAQINAQDALQAYIDAANFAVTILNLIQN